MESFKNTSENRLNVIKEEFETGKIKKVFKKHKLFIATVIVPTLISIVYFGFIASDVYISESQFLVRSSKPQQASALGMIFGGGFATNQSESHSVNAYILSRDALKNLNEKISIEQLFSSKNVDIFSRFGLFGYEQNFEGLHRYYQKRVSVYLDTVTSITSLRVSAFKAVDAQRVNELLLQDAESHVNKLNERARQDMIKFAKQDLVVAQKAAEHASNALNDYRNHKHSVFNPSYFEQLAAEKAITLEQLKNRHASYISASDEARRQFLYLERLAEPHLPDYAFEPRRIRTIFSTFILGLISWGVLGMLLAGVREHHD